MHWKRRGERGDRLMCYTRKDQSFEEVRRLRAEQEASRRGEGETRPTRREPEKDKPLTEKVKEMVGAR
jgi:hypothetical protein